MRILLITTLALLANIALTLPSRSAPFETMPDESVRHTISGFIFPKSIGVFGREKTTQYNEAGSDVSAGYNAGILAAATVYVYPAPEGGGAKVLAGEYASKQREVLHGHQGAVLVSERPMTISQGDRKLTGQRAYFSFRDLFARTPQDLKSQLLVFRDGALFIEYRFTYPSDHAAQAEPEIEDFIQTWSWRSPPGR
jgi:hypothetical protein